MKKLAWAALLLAAAPLAVAATTKAHNWLATTAVTPGGHRIGNPAAPTKLMEFVSYTCPHCGHFFKEADGAIKIAYVQPGKVSVEVHHVIRDPIDLAAVASGFVLRAICDADPARLAPVARRYPGARPVADVQQVLDDHSP